MNRVLAITGITGKSGTTFAEQIAQNRDSVGRLFNEGIRVFVRDTSDTRRMDMLLPDVEKCVVELTDVESLKKNLRNVDTLVHIAGIHWSKEIVTAAAYAHVRRMILVHTTGIYSKYKAAGEEYRQIDAFVREICEANEIKLTILRPTMIYGCVNDHNVITFIKMVDKLPVMPVVNGAKYELQPVHYSDLGKAYYKVLMNEDATANKDFILSGGAPIMLRDMLTVIGSNLGKQVHFLNCPYWLAYLGAWIIYCLTLKKKDYREKVQRLCEPRVFSHEEAKECFEYEPMTFEKGIVNEALEYRKISQQ